MIPRDVRYVVTSLPMQAGNVPAGAPTPVPTPVVALENVPSTMIAGTPAAAQVRNTGTVPATWSSTAGSGFSITPSNGTLAPGATQALALSTAIAGPYSLSVTVAGGSATGSPASIVVGDTVTPPTLSLTALGGLSVLTGAPLNFGVVLANPGTLPLVGTPENVAGTAVFSPTTVNWSLGDLNKAFAATWAAAGTKSIRVTAPGGLVSNTLNVTVSNPPPPPPPTPTLATLSGSASATAGAAHTDTVTLDVAADQVYTVTWARSNSATGLATSTIAIGQTTAVGSSTWPAAGSGRTVDFTISPVLTRAGRPLAVTVAAAPATAPTLATLSGSNTASTGVAHTDTVTLNTAADQTYTITWTRSNGGTGAATSTISAGQTSVSASTTWAAAGSGRTVDFTISPAISRAGNPLPVTVSTTALPSTGTPQPFTLTSASSGALPFALGYAMSQGHVPSGQSLTFAGAIAKLTVLSTWPDGSARHGIIAGTYTSGGSAVTVTPTVATVVAGTALTGAAVQTAMGANTAVFDAGAFGSATFSGADFATPFKTHAATDGFIEAIYRKAVGSDAHLVAWLALRVWSSGAVEALPWIENGYLTVSGPANKSATYSFTLGGTSRFSAAIDVKHHTRIPLLTGSTFAYWLGTDPAVTFAHSAAYLMATKLVPNYGFGAPSSGVLDALQQTYAANTLAGISSSMGVAGSSTAIINNQQAYYITSGCDSRALKAALVFGFSGGSWSTHYRDEATNLPLDLPDYPGITLQGGAPAIPAATGGENGTPVTTHQPSYGYLPYLITGRWWFLEEAQFWTAYNFLAADTESRRGRTAYATGPYLYADGAAGIIDPRAGTYAHRGAHWSIRTLAQTLAITPSTHPNAAGYQAVWENNTNFYNAVFVTGTHAPGWVSPMGMLGEYSAVDTTPISPNGSTAWWGNVWMSLFGAQAWGFASNLGLTQSTASANRMEAVRDQSYTHIVDRAGDGLSGRPNWRRFTVFKFPWGTDGAGLPPETTWTAAQGFAEYESRWSLASLDPALGGSLKVHQGDSGNADSDISAGTSAATDYLPFGLTALAFAVDHGKPGAYAGLKRLESASNFAAVTADLANNPGHTARPMSPSWLPAEGTFADISLNTLSAAAPSGWPTSESAGPFINWVGGQWAKDFGAAGGYVVHGSGHLTPGAALFAGVWVFDLASRRWVGRNVPASPLLENVANFNTDGESTLSGNLGHTYPPHTYDGLVYVPATVAGNASGKLVKNWWPGSTWRNSVHAFDLDSTTSPAVRVIDDISMSGSSNNYPASAYDAARGGYWLLTANGAGPLKFVNASTWAVTNYTGIAYGAYGDQSLVYIPSLDCLVGMGRGDAGNTVFKVFVCPIVGGVPQGFTEVTPTGTKPSDGRCGGQWSDWLGGIICYVGDGSYAVHKLTPPSSGSLTAGTWAWTSQTLTGASGATPARPGLNTNNGLPYEGNGSWGRFVEIDYLPGTFLWASSITGTVQAWRVNKYGTWA